MLRVEAENLEADEVQGDDVEDDEVEDDDEDDDVKGAQEYDIENDDGGEGR